MNKMYLALFSFVTSSTIMSMEPEVKKMHITLERVKMMCAGIHEKVKHDGLEPRLLAVIMRGGMIPGGIVAGESMFNNRNILPISIESYDDSHQQKNLKLRFPLHLEDYQDFKSVLLIDDIADTGETLEFALNLLKKELVGATIKSAVLFYKPKSKIKPDYYIQETTDWIVFPWEE